MQRFIILVICCMVYVRADILEVPLGCTHDTFKISGILNFKKQSPLQFTVDNGETVAADALKGSKKVYKTTTSDTFSLIVVPPGVGLKRAFVTNQLCFSIKGVEEVMFQATVFPGVQPELLPPEKLQVTDPSIWTWVCWSRPTGANSKVTIDIKPQATGEIKNLMMKYCLARA